MRLLMFVKAHGWHNGPLINKNKQLKRTNIQYGAPDFCISSQMAQRAIDK
jgi:hypothetical protein